jgi:hypothetical protein
MVSKIKQSVQYITQLADRRESSGSRQEQRQNRGMPKASLPGGRALPFGDSTNTNDAHCHQHARRHAKTPVLGVRDNNRAGSAMGLRQCSSRKEGKGLNGFSII